MMNNFDRHDRVRSLITELAAEFVRNEANTEPLITVTGITTSKDYRQATVFITTVPNEREQDALVFLTRHAGEFRNFVKRKSNLKIIPHFEFKLDAGERHRQHIDEIVRNISEEKKD